MLSYQLAYSQTPLCLPHFPKFQSTQSVLNKIKSTEFLFYMKPLHPILLSRKFILVNDPLSLSVAIYMQIFVKFRQAYFRHYWLAAPSC